MLLLQKSCYYERILTYGFNNVKIMSRHFRNMWHLHQNIQPFHQNMCFVFLLILFFFTHGYSFLQFDFRYIVGSQTERQMLVSSFQPLPPKTRPLGSTFSNTAHFLDFINLSSCNISIYNREVFETWVVVLLMGGTLLEMLSSNDY
jgi:hypothetical protein